MSPRLTSGCLRRMCLLMEARVDTLVPHSWQLCASTLSWVSWTCFCSMYSVTYFLSHTEQVHCLPTSYTHKWGRKEKCKSAESHECLRHLPSQAPAIPSAPLESHPLVRSAGHQCLRLAGTTLSLKNTHWKGTVGFRGQGAALNEGVLFCKCL